MSSNSSRNILSIIGNCLYVVCGFFAAQLLVLFALRALIELHLLRVADLDRPLAQLFLLAVAYSLALALIVLTPRLFVPKQKENIKKLLAIAVKPRLRDLGFSVLGFGTYLALTLACSFIVQAVWRGFNANQVQQVGFQGLSNSFEYVLAFIALVVVPPIVEELLFRGYLFGKLRARSGFWPSAIVTSVVFGAVHLQWNVGIDVFALSLVLCYLRERTGAVWAGIVLHMIKNTVAFTFLFLHPDILGFFNNLVRAFLVIVNGVV